MPLTTRSRPVDSAIDGLPFRFIAVAIGGPWTMREFELCASEDMKPEQIARALLRAYPGFGKVPSIEVTDLGRRRCSFGGYRHFKIVRKEPT